LIERQRISLTGATGYLGQLLAERLLGDGHEVVALVRETSDPAVVDRLRRWGALTSIGDVTDRYSLRTALSGADWVIHAAADVDLEGPPERMRAVNVEGSANVASLAYKIGVGRLLSVSSMARWGGSPGDGTAATEDSPVLDPPTLYSATKDEGERAIHEWARQGLKVSTVYPSLIYGPPGKPRGTNALLARVARGEMPLLVGGDRRLSWVHADDVVDGIARVLEHDARPEHREDTGRGWLLAGEIAPLREVVEKTAALAGVAPPRLSAPVPLAKGLVGAWKGLSRLGLPEPPVSVASLGSLDRHWAFDDSRARRELGWSPRGLDEGLPPTVAYLTGEVAGAGG
jgi:nucleoside-diphosphate-sugar epimerase